MKPAEVTAWNDAAGSIDATVNGGAEIEAWPLGWWPAVGSKCWVDEVEGTWVCLGPKGGAGQGGRTPYHVTLDWAGLLHSSLLQGAYSRIGNDITFRTELRCASDFSGGGSPISFGIPVTSTDGTTQIVPAEIYAAATGEFYGGIGVILPASDFVIPYITAGPDDANQGPLSNGGIPPTPAVSPFPLTSGSSVWIGGTYECAAPE